tara:strand:+ start:810 stop:2495 length:1686 start_codon:yes stop_codon:yes gene_type:complete
MKIWEKINNITGNNSKSRHLVPYLNAGSKFLLSALPEKFLWTIASESEINGFSEAGASEIGEGSSIAFDKVLAVYRFDSGKKRICVEAPDKNIHIFDEASSLLKATKMFPKFYKLSGKIYIKPDPDYNNQSGNNTETYTELGASSVTSVSAGAGDKGVIVYSAPPIVDENTDSWILAEYENIVLFYAASLDHFRLSSVYRDLCKVQIDGVANGTLNLDTTVFIPSGVNITKSLTAFAFTTELPNDFSITKALPSTISLTKSLPTISGIASPLPSAFTPPDVISSPSELSHNVDVASVGDALNKAQSLIDDTSGGAYTTSAEGWLADEDSEMTAATIGVANAELGRAQAILAKEKTKLEGYSSDVNQKLSKYQNDISNYSSEVQKESSRVSSELAKYQADISKQVAVFQSDVAEYQAEISKEGARANIDVSNYNAELNKEKIRIETSLGKWQADLSKAVQVFQSNLQIYQAEVQSEVQRIGADVSRSQADVAKASADLQRQIQQFGLDMQAAAAYTQKSQASIQTSGMYYQRAMNELSAITGSVAAPAQQQSSQRAEQGAST